MVWHWACKYDFLARDKANATCRKLAILDLKAKIFNVLGVKINIPKLKSNKVVIVNSEVIK